MVAAFPPGAQDVFVSSVGKMFLLLSHNFSWFCLFCQYPPIIVVLIA